MRISNFLWITVCLVLAKNYVDALKNKNLETKQSIIDVSKGTFALTNTEGKKEKEKKEAKVEEKTKTNKEGNNESTSTTKEFDTSGVNKKEKDITDKKQETNKHTVEKKETQNDTIENKEQTEGSNDTSSEKETNKGNKKDAELQNLSSENNESDAKKNTNLKESYISDDDFQTAKDVCNKVIMNNNAYQSFCNSTELFNMLHTIKETNKALSDEIMKDNYEVNRTSFNLDIMKDEKDIKVFKEVDMHNPNISVLFVFAKLCVGGIPLACGNILKYETTPEYNETKNSNGKNFFNNEEKEYEKNSKEFDNEDEEGLWDDFNGRESVNSLTNDSTENDEEIKS